MMQKTSDFCLQCISKEWTVYRLSETPLPTFRDLQLWLFSYLYVYTQAHNLAHHHWENNHIGATTLPIKHVKK